MADPSLEMGVRPVSMAVRIARQIVGSASRFRLPFVSLASASLLAVGLMSAPAGAASTADRSNSTSGASSTRVALVTPAVDRPCPTGRSLLKQPARLDGLSRLVRGKAPLRVLAIGSSSTEGIGASAPARGYPARLEADLRERLHQPQVRVVNAGIGGETADTTVARLEKRLAKERFDFVVWQVGTNDAVRGDDEMRFRKLLERGVKAVHAAGADMVFLDQQFFPSIRDPVKYEHYVGVIASVAKERHVPVLSRYRLMKAWGERTATEFPEMLSSDGFHMSDRGYLCLARAMAGAVTELAGFGATGQTIAAAPAGSQSQVILSDQ